MEEIWKDIPGYEGMYQASNLGRVKSLKWNREKIMKLSNIKGGYLGTALSKDKKQRTFYTHQLLAITFLGHTVNGNKSVVDHIDEDKTNNRLNNLQIISHRENLVKGNLTRKTSSKYTGVCWSKVANKWVARIYMDVKYKHLGCFIIEEDAAEAYQNALKQIQTKEKENNG